MKKLVSGVACLAILAGVSRALLRLKIFTKK